MWTLCKTILLMTLLLACNPPQKPLKIAANQWVGYTPLFYANEKGWLQEDGFSLKFVSSLSESLNLFNTHSVDIMTSTQYEYSIAKRQNSNIVPVLLFDRSNGGDMILSNHSISILSQNTQVDVYLEQASINSLLLDDFIKKHHLNPKNLILHEANPLDLKQLKPKSDKAILIITYAPYHLPLLQRGFNIVASTKTLQSLLVLDFLCTDKLLLTEEYSRFQKLKKRIDDAISISQKDPKMYYSVVKPYLGGSSFQNFIQDIDSIQWTNTPSPKLLKAIEAHGIDIRNILR